MNNVINPLVFSGNRVYFVTFIASFLIYFMYFGIFLLWVIPGKFSRKNFLHALFASFIAWGLSELLKYLFPTFRPFEIQGGSILTITIPQDPGFPSAHSAASFAIASSVAKYDKRTGIFFMVGAFLVALGRILGNVHSITDIIGGIIIGICSVLILDKLHILKR